MYTEAVQAFFFSMSKFNFETPSIRRVHGSSLLHMVAAQSKPHSHTASGEAALAARAERRRWGLGVVGNRARACSERGAGASRGGAGIGARLARGGGREDCEAARSVLRTTPNQWEHDGDRGDVAGGDGRALLERGG